MHPSARLRACCLERDLAGRLTRSASTAILPVSWTVVRSSYCFAATVIHKTTGSSISTADLARRASCSVAFAADVPDKMTAGRSHFVEFTTVELARASANQVEFTAACCCS